ncbi:MAG: beta-glucosidase [Spirochaetales bacterium]|nr:beta-glucosidase [Spirochaetales bacterium]
MNFTGIPEDFIWGVATSAFQIEGATTEDGRGLSIWDTFCKTPGKIHQGHNAEMTCDHYHRYKEDIKLMKQLGIQSYRFSLAWPRIFPQGKGKLNQKGIDFYNSLIDELCKNDITPAITLYHWDLPQSLEDQGGWRNRETASIFLEYAKTCFAAFHDRVPMWITFNEPFCSAYLGHYHGCHAPGIQDMQATANTIHHINLAHGLTVQAFREKAYKGKIGITQMLIKHRPATRSEQDKKAAQRATDYSSSVFMDPLFGKGYPKEFLYSTPEVNLPVQKGDLDIISEKMDFLGINYYAETAMAYNQNDPEKPQGVESYYPKTEMDWPVVPAGLYRMLKWLDEKYSSPEIYITENGCALPDTLEADGESCHDPDRISYLREHFKMCKKAIADGIKLKGYFHWSIMDNFEWAYGYSKRFGLIYSDYKSLKRIPKDSFYFYREVIAGHEPLE